MQELFAGARSPKRRETRDGLGLEVSSVVPAQYDMAARRRAGATMAIRRNRETEESRTTRSLAGLAVTLFLVVIGLFLTQKLAGLARLEDCLLSGRSNCEPVRETAW